MTAISEHCLETLRKDGPMTTRRLTDHCRKVLGRKVVNVKHATPVPVGTDIVYQTLLQLERNGLVQRRGIPSEWRAR